jgi:hypothetical protein
MAQFEVVGKVFTIKYLNKILGMIMELQHELKYYRCRLIWRMVIPEVPWSKWHIECFDETSKGRTNVVIRWVALSISSDGKGKAIMLSYSVNISYAQSGHKIFFA